MKEKSKKKKKSMICELKSMLVGGGGGKCSSSSFSYSAGDWCCPGGCGTSKSNPKMVEVSRLGGGVFAIAMIKEAKYTEPKSL